MFLFGFNSIDKKLCSPGGRGDGPVVSDTSRATLLPSTDPSAPSSAYDGSNLQNNLVGQYKGFSIVPIPKSTGTSGMTPTRPAPVTAPTSAHRVSPPKVPANTINQHLIPYPVRPAPKIPPTSVGLAVNNPEPITTTMCPTNNLPPHRPDISSPVLDATTSFTANELIDKVPLRPAPSVPPQESKSNPVRPVSTTVSNDVGLETKIVKPRDTAYPTLTRIASFMSRGQKASQDVKKDTNKTGKIDRDSLKTIEISNPILQKEISVPASSLPAGEKAVVMRAQSLRSTVPDKRPSIPSFGSMRVPGNKRPTSIPAANRPSSPPPPRPPSIGVPGYQTPGKVDNTYDDCLNLLTEGVAPLANIDEESPSATDNIYAVIEESPTDRRGRKEIILPKKLEYTSPTGEYKTPKPIENSVSAGSAESMGLLGEIVSEIQARNTDSIYSTSTLNRKKEREKEKDDDETASTVTDMSCEVDKNQTYVNTPWRGGVNSPPKSSASSTTSSSGYLSPINPNLSNKTNNLTKTEAVKVPDTTAPYKPYVQRTLGPIVSASLATKPATNSAQTSVENSRSNALGVSENKSGSIKTNPIPKQVLQNLNNKSVSNSRNIVRKNSEGLSSVKPDLVSSCSPSGVKSPDVLGGKEDVKSATLGNIGGLASKPAIGKPGSSFRGGRQPLPAPKPTVIPNAKTSITSQPLPAIPTGNKTKPTISKSLSVKSDNNEVDIISKANKPSSVASLQQKFDVTKQTKPPALSKGTVAKNNVNSTKSSNIKR